MAAAGGDSGDKFSSSFDKKLSVLGKQTADRMGQAGRRGGTAFAREINRRVEAQFARMRSRLADILIDKDTFVRFAAQFDSTSEALDQLNNDLLRVRDSTKGSQRAIRAAGEEYEEYRATIVNLANTNKELIDTERERRIEMERGVKGANAFERALTGMAKRVGNSWRRMDSTVRLVLTLIATAADQAAALGSAAGAGLIGLGAAASQAVVGIVGLGTVFARLAGDIEKVPAHLRPVVREFNDFKSVFGDVADSIANSAFAEMDGVFSSLKQSVAELNPAFSKLGTAIGKTFDRFAQAVRPGSDALLEVEKLIDNSAKGFDDLAGIIGQFGLAFIRAFNGAQPLVEQLYGWLGLLADRFDAFTQGPGLDEWVGNAQEVFHSLGGLLDAVGRALNDLVTPDAIQRTTDLLDGLADFMPVLSDILDIFGRLDLLGHIVDLLNAFGEVITPLVPTLQVLADALDAVLEVVINPGLAGGLIALGGAFALARGSKGLGDLSKKLAESTGAMSGMSGPTGKLSSAMGKLGRVLGVGGAVVGGIFMLIEAAKNVAREITDVDGVVRELVGSNTSLAGSYDKLNGVADGLAKPLTDVQGALDGLAKVGNPIEMLPMAFDDTGQQALALAGTLGELDKGISQLPLDAASEQFSAWATELGASDEQVLQMLNKMPAFKKQLEASAASSGKLATDQELVRRAMEGSISPTEKNKRALADLGDEADLTRDDIEDLADAIRDFGDESIDVIEAQSDFEQALDDLTESLKENGTELSLTEKAGRENTKAILEGVQSVKDYAAELYLQSESQEVANQTLRDGRQALIDQVKEFDPAGYKAGKYTDLLNLIPDDIDTVIELPNIDESGERVDTYRYKVEDIPGFTSTDTQLPTIMVAGKRVIDFSGMIKDVPDETKTDTKLPTIGASQKKVTGLESTLNRLNGKEVNSYVTVTTRVREGGGSFATGGILTGPHRILAGEAGPEAIVPLRRPLSQVDPSVRALSAIAQGMTPSASMASGGIVAPGRVVNISPGAISIVGPDPWRAATETVNRIVERVVN